MEENIPPISKRKYFYVAGIAIVFFLLIIFMFTPPKSFPVDTLYVVESGASLRKLSRELKNQNFIRSQVLFEALVIMKGGEKDLKSGKYIFEKKVSVVEVARRISSGERGVSMIRVTIPEGSDYKDISKILGSRLLNFNTEEFEILAKEKEGYLFPDTYFLFSTDEPKEILKILESNFKQKVKPLKESISLSGKTEEDVVVMASIIEREASGSGDREMISGILWKRLRIGMPLQADAAPITYEEKGLPESPIANPGILSIKAAIHPKDSPYLYYIHDKNGDIHYARNFTEHRANIEKYLK